MIVKRESDVSDLTACEQRLIKSLPGIKEKKGIDIQPYRY